MPSYVNDITLREFTPLAIGNAPDAAPLGVSQTHPPVVLVMGGAVTSDASATLLEYVVVELSAMQGDEAQSRKNGVLVLAFVR